MELFTSAWLVSSLPRWLVSILPNTRDAIGLGVNDYLLKPFSINEACKSIESAAKRRQLLMQRTSSDLLDIQFDAVSADQGNTFPFFSFEHERRLLRYILLCENQRLEETLHEFFFVTKNQNILYKHINQSYMMLYFALQRLADEYKIQKYFSFESLEQLAVKNIPDFEKIIAEFCYRLSDKLESCRSPSPVISQAIKFIEEHYSDMISLQIVAEHVFVSPNYLSSLFRSSLDKCFIDYLQEFRIHKAQELIDSFPTLKNYEVAERVGFNSSKYFSTVFRKITDMTPSQYRLQQSSK